MNAVLKEIRARCFIINTLAATFPAHSPAVCRFGVDGVVTRNGEKWIALSGRLYPPSTFGELCEGLERKLPLPPDQLN